MYYNINFTFPFKSKNKKIISIVVVLNIRQTCLKWQYFIPSPCASAETGNSVDLLTPAGILGASLELSPQKSEYVDLPFWKDYLSHFGRISG